MNNARPPIKMSEILSFFTAKLPILLRFTLWAIVIWICLATFSSSFLSDEFFHDFSRLLAAFFKTDANRIFSTLIILYFSISLIGVYLNSNRPVIRSMIANAPPALTTLGILGTFVGILIGLLDFDIRLINRSVPELLEGLKIAFATSILGLFAALAFRVLRPLLMTTQVTEEDKVGILIAEVQQLRSSVDNFTKNMSKSLTEAIFNELRDVIREFNEKISEQFGENFKKLNDAVGKLVEWQENYRQQMELIKTTIDDAIIGIQECQKSITKIAESAESIPVNLKKWNDITDDLQEKMEAIEVRLQSALTSIAEKADDVVDKTAKATKLLVDSFDDSRETQKQMLDGMQKAITKATEEFDKNIQNQTQTIMDELGSEFLGIIQRFGDIAKQATTKEVADE